MFYEYILNKVLVFQQIFHFSNIISASLFKRVSHQALQSHQNIININDASTFIFSTFVQHLIIHV